MKSHSWKRDPAPPGWRPATRRSDRPPDGWHKLDPTAGDVIVASADRALLQGSRIAMSVLSRRTFLKRVGQLSVVAGLATATTLFATTPAYARCYQCGDPCGPSPNCGDPDCTDDSGNCKLSENVEKRDHDDFFCTSCTGLCTCWAADCCGCGAEPNQRKKLCCDCCEPDAPNTCASPCTNKKACICISALGCP